MTVNDAIPRPTCDRCGAPDGLLAFENGLISEYQCRACILADAPYTAAYAQLEVLVRRAVRDWQTVWGHLPRLPDLDELLMQIGGKLDDEQKARELAPD